jgi:alpha-methylacyl-CoA racemase
MGVLDGVTVLDLTRLLPGAVASMMLGDFGARVIKVESPGGGDPMRYLPLGTADPEASFRLINRNKRSVVIDLKSEAGREIFGRLVDRADVVLEGFRPGVMDRLGMGEAVLRARNPRLIYCALTGFGQEGPNRLRPGHDANYLALAGLLGLNGEREGPPRLPGVQIADLAGGSLHAVIGILLALLARERTGLGQGVDIAMLDCSLTMMFIPLAQYLAERRQPARGAEALTGRYACYQIYGTRDGRYLTLAALEPKFWEAFCRRLGREEWIGQQFDPQAQPLLIEALSLLFQERTLTEWIAQFAGVETCLAPVLELAEVLEDPQIRARGLVVEVESEGGQGREIQLAPVIRLSLTPGRIDLPPPRLGAQTWELLTELGCTPAQIDAWIDDGVVEGPRPEREA